MKTPPIERRVSIVVPVRYGGPELARCLEAIGRLSPAPLEVVVVVDGGDAVARSQAEGAGFRVLAPVHGGPAAARNLGAGAARGEWVFFLDSDVVVGEDAVARVAETFEKSPGTTAVFGSYDDRPRAAGFFSQFKNLFHHFVHQRSHPEASTFWAGCGAVRRSAFLAVGGFDVRYVRPSIEDVELGYRLRERGHRIRLRKDLQVTHLKRWTLIQLLLTDIRDRAVPWSRLLRGRRDRLVNDLNLMWSDRLSAGLVLALLGAGAGAALGWLPAGALALPLGGLVVLNLPLYRFFLNRRGPWFVLGAVAYHWLYLLYGSLVFAVVACLPRRRVEYVHAGALTEVAVPAGGRLPS